MLSGQIVTVAGGSGFLGRYVVKHLAKAGYTVRVLCRNPNAAYELKVSGTVGQIVVDYADVTKPETLATVCEGSHAVINLTGILYESGRQKFSKIHAQGAEMLARNAKAAGAEQYVHVSALGVDRATHSTYARTKLEGEKAVRNAFPEATILRPSVVFGAEDDFINYFAWLGKLSPMLPAPGGGKTTFQPVFVDDVAKAIVASLHNPAAAGQTYELGGPDVMSFSQILDFVDEVTGRSRGRMPLPFPIASMVGSVMQLLPCKPPLTYDQVQLLKTDNICSGEFPGLEALGITAVSMKSEVPRYLSYMSDAHAA